MCVCVCVCVSVCVCVRVAHVFYCPEQHCNRDIGVYMIAFVCVLRPIDSEVI